VVNEEEASRVQSIFESYLQRQSLAGVLEETQRRGWTTKQWQTRDGKERRGRPFTKASLHRLLSSVLYLGKVSHQDAVYAGEQAPIVEEGVWKLVHEKLAQEGRAASLIRDAQASAIVARRSAAGAERNGCHGSRVCWRWL
jgi:site-specific DNA recombinase